MLVSSTIRRFHLTRRSPLLLSSAVASNTGLTAQASALSTSPGNSATATTTKSSDPEPIPVSELNRVLAYYDRERQINEIKYSEKIQKDKDAAAILAEPNLDLMDQKILELEKQLERDELSRDEEFIQRDRANRKKAKMIDFSRFTKEDHEEGARIRAAREALPYYQRVKNWFKVRWMEPYVYPSNRPASYYEDPDVWEARNNRFLAYEKENNELDAIPEGPYHRSVSYRSYSRNPHIAKWRQMGAYWGGLVFFFSWMSLAFTIRFFFEYRMQESVGDPYNTFTGMDEYRLERAEAAKKRKEEMHPNHPDKKNAMTGWTLEEDVPAAAIPDDAEFGWKPQEENRKKPTLYNVIYNSLCGPTLTAYGGDLEKGRITKDTDFSKLPYKDLRWDRTVTAQKLKPESMADIGVEAEERDWFLEVTEKKYDI